MSNITVVASRLFLYSEEEINECKKENESSEDAGIRLAKEDMANDIATGLIDDVEDNFDFVIK